ncbi:MAG TPA: hypothetical protein PKD78_16950, partial [Saprospiraceae bacterium]|nr:hypothetical protein [Saprospiraceae bacterium]
MSDLPLFLGRLRHLIGQNQMPDALDLLRELLHNSPRFSEAIHQSGRWSAVMQQVRAGTVSHADATLAQNQIRSGVLDMLDDLEREWANTAAGLFSPTLREELKAAVEVINSKNVVLGNITAGGNVHIGDITYAHAPLSPLRPLNEHLTRHLILAIQPYSVAATRFLEKVRSLPDWYAHPQAGDKAREILAYSFVGVIGIQLSKLFAIGKEEFAENTLHKYVEKCLQLARRSLDLVVFTLISQLWEEQRKQPRSLEALHMDALRDFFDRAFEPSMGEQLQLLHSLYALFQAHALPFALPELAELGPSLQPLPQGRR